jgi:hypothetical protein
MTVAIHQPNYLPWLGYFYKIFACDVFVFHDVVDFSKGSYTKRCRIRSHRTSADTTWLTVPLQKHHIGSPITEILIAERSDWIPRHVNKIENTYRAAPFFDEMMPWLRQIMSQAQTIPELAEVNKVLIKHILERLSIPTEYRSSADMKLHGKGTELIIQVMKHLGGDRYLAGTGSQRYQDDQLLQEAGIMPVMHDFGSWLKAHPYDQGTGKFTGGLSIVDALMHIGTDGIREVFQQFRQSAQ